MKVFFKNYFNFNKSERKTVLVLLILIFLVFTTLFFVRNIPPKTGVDYSHLDEWMDSLSRSSKIQDKSVYSFRDFDPNLVSIEEMIEMGIRKKNAQTLIKYRKYHYFKTPEELKELYFMTDELYAQMESFVKIVPRSVGSKNKNRPAYDSRQKKDSYSSFTPDINTADTSELKKVFGIGSYLARNLVWYRNKLGGYVNKNQLREVKGMRAESFEKIKNKVVMVKLELKRINLNDAEWKEIVQHPYISKDQTNRIVKYRKEFGSILNSEELVVVGIFTKEEETKLKPYLEFFSSD